MLESDVGEDGAGRYVAEGDITTLNEKPSLRAY